MKKLFVLDLMNLAMRAFHGFSRSQDGLLTTSAGKFTFVCYGVALALNKLIAEHEPDFIFVATDTRGRTFRHEMYEGYKSNRKPADDLFVIQLPDLFRMLEAYGLTVLRAEATEADDIIGTVCKKFAGYEILSSLPPNPDGSVFDLAVLDKLDICIVSGDKDYMQLIGPHVSILKPENMGTYRHIGKDQVFEKFGVAPEQVVDALAIIGDAVDMVPGVAGIGEKGAQALLQKFGTLENTYANLGGIKLALANKLAKSRDMAFLSKKLVTIKCDIPVRMDLDAAAVRADILKRPELLKFFAEMEFNSMLTQGADLVADSGSNWLNIREEPL